MVTSPKSDLAVPAPVQVEDIADRAAHVHRWFRAESPAGPVLVAHRNDWISGLVITSADNRKVSGESDAERITRYMRDQVGLDVDADPNPDWRFVSRVNEALANGRTDLPVDLSSRSPFHREVLRAITRIPKGEVRTYGEVAALVGRPKAARAVGTAMARNPVPLLVPCHRVVPSSGGVGNYGYGSDLKAKLLANEGANL